MIRERDRELERRLKELHAPNEAGAEERSWAVIQEAYRERTPVRPAPRQRRLALALAAGVAVIAIGLSPAGAEVGDFVSEVVGLSEEDAKPALGPLPAAGELLVETADGTWIVRDDGSKRLLGEYTNAEWSPNGRYVAAADGGALVVLDPAGEVQWTLPTPGSPDDIAWEGSFNDTRIAYRVDDDLYVVGGDGLGDHRVASDVGAGTPLWIEAPGVTKVDPAGASGFPYLLAFLDSAGSAQVIEPDAGAPVDVDLQRAERRALSGEFAVDPTSGNRRVARVDRRNGRSALIVSTAGRARVLFSGPGRLTEPVWSPDGRWLVFGWREADQWVFLPPDHPKRITGVNRISGQLDPEDGAAAGFPRVRGWVLPSR